MAEAIVSSTVEMLGNLLTEEVSFLSGVKNQVEEIKIEFKSMQCLLKDADRRSNMDERVRNWINRVRMLAYKIEDVLETYAIKVESRKEKGMKSKVKRYAWMLDEWVNLHKLGSEIGNIKTEIASIASSLQTYGIKFENEGESSNAARNNLLRQTFAHEIDKHFVGMQNDIDSIVAFMTDRDEDHRIISIYGMGGLGKTTLARKVFNDKVVRSHFQSFAWIALSQQFDPDNVLKEVLRQLDISRDKNGIERMKYVELVQELHEFQRERKCLVVIDDIWKIEDWDVLKSAFPTNSVHNKVLLTTRIQSVAEIGIPHKLNLFNEEEGWQLIKKMALNNTKARDSNLEAEQEKLGKDMVRKCGYLPLAISVIGGILSKNGTLEGWENVMKNIDTYLRCDEGVGDNYRVMQILTLSYDDLPCQLKPCLLYLASYPEDAEIEVQNLCRMLIAEGFISSMDQRCNESLLEVAERYLTVLARGSLVQVQLNDEISGTCKSYRLHDLIRDLCLRKCKEEDFLKLIESHTSNEPKYEHNSVRGNAYRLFIYGYDVRDNVDDEIFQEANEGARSFSLRYLKPGRLMSCEGLKSLRNLRFLRVVAFESLDFSKTKALHKVIKKLIHLRYLSFENCILDEVPSSVGMLTYLQTFDIRSHSVTSYNVKIPNVFWKLKRLVHFIVYGVTVDWSHCDFRLDFSSGLETLIFFEPHFGRNKSPSKLTNLRYFASSAKGNKSLSSIINYIESNLCSVPDIKLIIEGECDFIRTEDGPMMFKNLFLCRISSLCINDVPIKQFPMYESGMLTSSDLTELNLSDNHMEKDPMPTLEKLPKLKILGLKVGSFDGEELICSSTGFPNLKKLHLSTLPNLKNWRIDDGAMPHLSTVTISYCLKLEMIPTGMKFLKALRDLNIWEMPKEFNNRIRKVDGEEGIDFHKVRHVPSIDFRGEIL